MPHIAHVGIWTTDLERLKTFYETHFQAQAGPKYVNQKRQFESYFLTFEGGARLELMRLPELGARAGAAATIGFAHLGVAVGSREAVDALTARLRAAGCTIAGEPRLTGDGYYESVVLDPDGNRIELTA